MAMSVMLSCCDVMMLRRSDFDTVACWYCAMSYGTMLAYCHGMITACLKCHTLEAKTMKETQRYSHSFLTLYMHCGMLFGVMLRCCDVVNLDVWVVGCLLARFVVRLVGCWRLLGRSLA